MLYGQRRGELRGAEKRRLNEFEMKCLRRMAGVTRMDIMSGMSITNLNGGGERVGCWSGSGTWIEMMEGDFTQG